MPRLYPAVKESEETEGNSPISGVAECVRKLVGIFELSASLFQADVRFNVRQPGLIARVYGALEASGGILYRRGGIQCTFIVHVPAYFVGRDGFGLVTAIADLSRSDAFVDSSLDFDHDDYSAVKHPIARIDLVSTLIPSPSISLDTVVQSPVLGASAEGRLAVRRCCRPLMTIPGISRTRVDSRYLQSTVGLLLLLLSLVSVLPYPPLNRINAAMFKQPATEVKAISTVMGRSPLPSLSQSPGRLTISNVCEGEAMLVGRLISRGGLVTERLLGRVRSKHVGLPIPKKYSAYLTEDEGAPLDAVCAQGLANALTG
ncbi:hypothetical protein ARMGADRAFT_1085970 [Armillaria gallica]|uniref:Uncharacterized protein n=1 Tax=Armillaria gallica TaxID=47427 RepID=A0A2H3D7N0_ARMGA|nr:hypothetical protein ARMGADRAFT_1085970 [Armillaria gallica]